jgi:hypothetical protein
MTKAEILEFVFSSGGIQGSSDDQDSYIAEVEQEVRFEASERIESGEYEGTVDEAVEFAIAHVS